MSLWAADDDVINVQIIQQSTTSVKNKKFKKEQLPSAKNNNEDEKVEDEKNNFFKQLSKALNRTQIQDFKIPENAVELGPLHLGLAAQVSPMQREHQEIEGAREVHLQQLQEQCRDRCHEAIAVQLNHYSEILAQPLPEDWYKLRVRMVPNFSTNLNGQTIWTLFNQNNTFLRNAVLRPTIVVGKESIIEFILPTTVEIKKPDPVLERLVEQNIKLPVKAFGSFRIPRNSNDLIAVKNNTKDLEGINLLYPTGTQFKLITLNVPVHFKFGISMQMQQGGIIEGDISLRKETPLIREFKIFHQLDPISGKRKKTLVLAAMQLGHQTTENKTFNGAVNFLTPSIGLTGSLRLLRYSLQRAVLKDQRRLELLLDLEYPEARATLDQMMKGELSLLEKLENHQTNLENFQDSQQLNQGIIPLQITFSDALTRERQLVWGPQQLRFGVKWKLFSFGSKVPLPVYTKTSVKKTITIEHQLRYHQDQLTLINTQQYKRQRNIVALYPKTHQMGSEIQMSFDLKETKNKKFQIILRSETKQLFQKPQRQAVQALISAHTNKSESCVLKNDFKLVKEVVLSFDDLVQLNQQIINLRSSQNIIPSALSTQKIDFSLLNLTSKHHEERSNKMLFYTIKTYDEFAEQFTKIDDLPLYQSLSTKHLELFKQIKEAFANPQWDTPEDWLFYASWVNRLVQTHREKLIDSLIFLMDEKNNQEEHKTKLGNTFFAPTSARIELVSGGNCSIIQSYTTSIDTSHHR